MFVYCCTPTRKSVIINWVLVTVEFLHMKLKIIALLEYLVVPPVSYI
jgi:hypothetical protein